MNQRIVTAKKKLAENEIFILDGATGSELARRGIETSLPLWSAAALEYAPAIVQQIHQDYIHAGADVITTNTFRTNTRVMAAAGKDSKAFTLKACAVAAAAREKLEADSVLIAGCVGPIEDCYEPDLVPDTAALRREHSDLVAYLVEGNVDFIFIETMNCIREAQVVLDCAEERQVPYAVSFVCNQSGTLLSGESFSAVGEMLASYMPLFVSVNCQPPNEILPAFQALSDTVDFPLGVYANGAGCKEACSGWEFLADGTAADSYLEFAKQWRDLGASVIGGCCGTNPEYIRLLSNLRNNPQQLANA